MDWEGFFTQYRKPGFIPGYEVVNKLGSGVFGEVYKARKESIGKFYAIKFLKVSDEKVSEAIFKELDSLRYFAQLDHPNLVTIEDKGEVMGIPYIVMGYAGDDTLKKRLADGSMDPDVASEVFRQVCQGVAALHEKSIIHFDLKPANIFIKGTHPRVGDYGLSKLVSESHMTMSIGRGTPYYMAPEMLQRRGDHRSDIYSLGVILFEMLSGDVPFKGDSEWQVLNKHENEEVVVPDHVPAMLRDVILRAMAKKPEDRYQSVDDMVTDLGGGGSAGRIVEGAAAGVAAVVAPTPTGMPTTMPPLPTRPVNPTEVNVGNVRHAVSGIVTAVQRKSGAAAEQARKEFAAFNRGRGRHVSGDGSFYTDFDKVAPPAAHVEVTPAKIPGGAGEAPQPSPPSPRPMTFFEIIFWPITKTFWLIGAVFRLFTMVVGGILRDFVRNAIVVAITIGLAYLIHLAIT